MTFALPSDLPSLVALVVGALVLFHPAGARALVTGSTLRFRVVASLAAALLSAGYVLYYLRGGPRIVDATTYFLEGRALSEGHLSWAISEPPSATAGRFLVRDTLGDGHHLAGIFPPGWPAVLALGFRLGAPMLVGPALAFALTWLTVGVAERVATQVLGKADAVLVARVAGALTVVCGALRYHTADTMSHGLAAVCATAAIGAALELRAATSRRVHASLALGLALGWLVATRPVSGVACALVVLLALGRPPRVVEVACAALAASPGLALLVLHQHAATGAWGGSSQSLYYLASDGPPGCFRYGFGKGIGCLHEHGDFVEKNLPHGYGAWEALKTMLRRLKMHGVDDLNAEPLAPIAILAWASAWRHPASRVLAAFPLTLLLGYAPFYFDGNYPGGGARFLADGLPLELVAVALLTPRVAARLSTKLARSVTPSRIGAALVGLSLLGFAFRGHVDHEQLRDREGGRPMLEPSRLAASHVERGLLFVDTDHGFSIGFDPDARADRGDLEIVRLRGDATDRLLYDARGRPPAWLYDYDTGSGAAILAPFVPPDDLRIEGESLWPALSQAHGAAWPGYPGESCAPGKRTLQVLGFDGQRAKVRLALPTLSDSRIRIVAGGVASNDATVTVVDDRGVIEKRGLEAGICVETQWLEIPAATANLALVIEGTPAADGRVLTLDAIVLFHGKKSR